MWDGMTGAVLVVGGEYMGGNTETGLGKDGQWEQRWRKVAETSVSPNGFNELTSD
jgi:hypothetical protein